MPLGSPPSEGAAAPFSWSLAKDAEVNFGGRRAAAITVKSRVVPRSSFPPARALFAKKNLEKLKSSGRFVYYTLTPVDASNVPAALPVLM